MPIIYLLRHAQSTANARGILAGRDNEVELTNEGFNQARKLSQLLEKLGIEEIYSSPLTRCIQTIQPLRVRKSQIRFSIDERLIEMDYGSWSGKKLSDLSRKPEWRKIQNNPSGFRFPGGESFRAMRARVESMLKELDRRKKPILLVTHGDIVKMFLATAAGLKTDGFQKFIVEPGSISTISGDKDKYSIVSSNTLVNRSITNSVTNSIGGGDLLSRKLKWWKK